MEDGPGRDGGNRPREEPRDAGIATASTTLGTPAPVDLGSWKEIADYLGVNVRTAQKWEQDRGLPIRRLPGAKGRVSVDRDVLDRWRQTTLSRPSWYNNLGFLRLYSVVVTLVAVAGGVLAVHDLANHARGRPALFEVDGRTLFVFDAERRELWHQTFDAPLAVNEYSGSEGQQRTWFGDVDGDGSTEVVFLYHPANEASITSYLYCYSETGRVKWRFAPEAVVADAAQSYTPPYILAAFALTDSPDGGKLIAVTGRHTSYHPTSAALLDGRGRVRGQYWHTGHLDYVAFHDLDGDRVPEILLAGVDNAREQATLVVLDSRNVSGASFAGEGSPWQIRGMPVGTEKAVVYFPRTCVNRLYERYNMARDVTVTYDGLIRVRVFERLDQDEVVVHTLDRQLRSVRAVISDRLVTTHKRLEAEGRLDHPLTDAETASLRSIRVVRPRTADR